MNLFLDRQFLEFSSFIESDMNQLLSIKLETLSWQVESQLYYNSLVLYLKNDVSGLNHLLSAIKKKLFVQSDSDVAKYLVVLVEARFNLRNKSINGKHEESLSLIQEELRIKASDGNRFWKILLAESFLLKAMTHAEQSEPEKEFDCYLLAARNYEDCGLKRKSLKMIQNSIATEAQRFPLKNFIVDYQNLLRRALRQRDFVTAGLCALNISRDYQKLGSLGVALSFANKSLVYLKRDLGTSHYAFSLAQRASVLIELGRLDEARLDSEYLKVASHPEARAALSQIEVKLGISSIGNGFNSLATISPWRNRTWNLGSQKRISFGSMEELILQYLSMGAKTKFELVELVFRTESKCLDPEIVEMRFKNLIARIRKKAPHMIIFDKGLYKLTSSFSKDA